MAEKLFEIRELCEYLEIPCFKDEDGKFKTKRSEVRRWLDKLNRRQLSNAVFGESKEQMAQEAFMLDELVRDKQGRRRDRRRRPGYLDKNL